jgi:A/G-specific adenine glycosylase
MLQQTRAATVVPYWARWMRRLPTLGALARANLDVVLALWQGLGYYARARNFHAAARVVAERHRGRLPRERAARLALPGVGRYTAGALGSIAFGLPEPVLDGNVVRVLCRLHAIRADPRTPRVRERLWTIAAELVLGNRPGDLNQSLMELGATVCLPKDPRCDACPVSRHCRARGLGLADPIPAHRTKRPVPLVRGIACRIVRGRKWLVVRRPHGGLLGGLWELPGPLAGVTVGERIGHVVHVFTHRRLRLTIHEGTITGRVSWIGYADRKWATVEQIARLPMSRLHRKVVAVCCNA